MNFLKKAESGFAQLLVLGLMALVAAALPITTKLVQNNQENRSKAAEEIGTIGICGSVNGVSRYFFQISDEWLCSKGTPMDLKGVVDLQPGQTSPVTWSCVGSNDTLKVECAATQIYAANVAGVCGSADGAVAISKPKTSLCIAGVASEVTTRVDGSKNYYSWRCQGIHGGSSVDCSSMGNISIGKTENISPVISGAFLSVSFGKGVAKTSYKVGETFSVVVTVNSVGNLVNGVDSLLVYDPAVLSLVSLEKSPEMVFKNKDDNCAVNTTVGFGKIAFTCYSSDGSVSSAVNGELMTINFLVKKNTDSKIIFECTPGSTIESNIVSDGRDIINCSKNVGLLVGTSGMSGVISATPTPLPRPTSIGNCTNNSDRCDGNNYQVCKDGTWVTYQTCENGCDFQRKICILPAVSVAITSSTTTMKVGTSFQFKAQISPTNSTDKVFWHVSVPARYGAIIDANTNTGLMTALEEGQFTIMAKAMDANGNVRDEIRSKEMVVKIVKTIAVDGKCGSNRSTCVSGVPNNGALADTSSEYRWKCLGLEGGRDMNCSVKKTVTPTAVLNRPVNGRCGNKRNTCISGSVSIMVTSPTLYQWRCVGRYNGKTVICSIRK